MQKDHSPRLAQAKAPTPYLKNNLMQKRAGDMAQVLAYQVQSLKFKPQYCSKKKRFFTYLYKLL
jgi:hypothetical protein